MAGRLARMGRFAAAALLVILGMLFVAVGTEMWLFLIPGCLALAAAALLMKGQIRTASQTKWSTTWAWLGLILGGLGLVAIALLTTVTLLFHDLLRPRRLDVLALLFWTGLLALPSFVVIRMSIRTLRTRRDNASPANP